VILVVMSGNRAKSVTLLVREANGFFPCMLTASCMTEALELLKKTHERDPVMVTGSFYLVGEARRILTHGQA